MPVLGTQGAAATAIFTLPSAVLTEGKHAFASPQMGGQYSGYRFEIAQGLNWPTQGDVLEVAITRNGQPDCHFTLPAAPWLDDSKNLITTTQVDVSIGVVAQGDVRVVQATAVTDLFQISINVLQRCSPILKFYGLP